MKCVSLLLVAFTILGTVFSQESMDIELDPNNTTIEPTGKPTEPPATTTLSPAPPVTTPAPESGPWSVNTSDDVCILAKFGAVMNIEYILEDKSFKMGTITLPTNATVDSDVSKCKNESQILSLSFLEKSSLTLTFRKDGDKVILNEIKIEINGFKTLFPDATVDKRILDMGNLTQFSANAGHSYFCSKTTIAYNGKSSITFSDIQIEAYRSSTDKTFSLAEDCDSDVSNIVPIAVGCALAGLVVIVLIAYLVGRRHKRQRGYESQGL